MSAKDTREQVDEDLGYFVPFRDESQGEQSVNPASLMPWDAFVPLIGVYYITIQ